MGKKKSDTLYNRMRNGKEDLEKYYKERERFCNNSTCKGHYLKDREEMNADINRINKETQDRINKEQSRASLRMVTHFEGSSILPEDKRKFDEKWNAKFLEIGKLMEEKSLALKEEWEGKAQNEKEGEEETGKFKRPKLSDIVDKAKLKCEIFKWRKCQRVATVFIQMMTLWVIAHLGVILFMHIMYEVQLDLKRILTLCAGSGIGMVIHWALNRKIESLVAKAELKDKDWAERIREELKGWDLSC